MSRILHDLVQEIHQIKPEAVRALRPYLTKHANRLDQYHLDINQQPLPIRFDIPLLSKQAAVDDT